ncbi:hypothetical protein [Cypionkella aquatica]|nr:hypothetical protein [Cypionkella aquatica]
MLLLTAVAIVSLVTMFETMIRAQLSFGTALVVVLPLLVAARSSGALLVAHTQCAATLRQIIGYGLWCAVLGLIGLSCITLLLQLVAKADPRDLLRLFASRPATALAVLALAFGTCAVITCTGFALGTRAQARLLPTVSAKS